MTAQHEPHEFAAPAPPDDAVLVPFVSRLAIDWLATSPSARHRRVHGTVVFIDVSGFTALSERLAHRGRAGAEELTDILDGIFSRLLTRAWELGGGLVKFGGDALLLLFEGEDHAARGCAAAHDMRAELARHGRIATSSGPVTLRMSVGVHSAGFDFFLVGDSHRELVLTGPAASRTAATEAAAAADEILVTDDTAGLLPDACLGEARGVDRLLTCRPSVTGGVTPLPDLVAVDLATCVPAALRWQLRGSVGEPEHRIVTVAFVHIGGVDALLADAGPEVVADALEEVVTLAQHHIDAHGLCFLGTDLYPDGGKIIITAGAPQGHANDEERMLRALRGILDAPRSLPLRVGVNRGHVYTGEVGSPMRRTYTCMGDAVNLAARLMQAATEGTVLVTAPVLERSRTRYEATALPPFAVKGKSQPVRAFALGPQVGLQDHPTRHGEVPLIGRDAELAVLVEAISATRQRRGGVITLVGPAGIGKSRLVQEARAHAEDLQTIAVVCEQYEASTPYWAARWLLRRVLGIPYDASPEAAGILLRGVIDDRMPELAEWLPLLAIPVDADVPPTPATRGLDAEFRRAQTVRVTAELLRALLPDPVLLVFEDAFWMDDASRALVRRLCEDTTDRPWLVLLTTRDDDVDLAPSDAATHRTVRLEPLGAAAVAELAAAATEAAALPPHQLDALAARAEGSPLFLLELLAGATAMTPGGGGTGPTEQALPDSIEAAIGARIDTLAPGERLQLRCAAVLGTSFPRALADVALHAAAADTPDTRGWDRLEEFLVAEPGDRLRFRHNLVREVAYEGLPYRRRRDLHAAVARHLEQAAGPAAAGAAEVLALHYFHGECHEPAWRFARIAGDRARDKAATAEAAGFYRRALEAGQTAEVPDGAIAAVAERLGDVCELAGLYEEGTWAYRTARRLRSGDALGRADLLRKEGLVLERAGRYTAARLLYRSGLHLLGDRRGRQGPAPAPIPEEGAREAAAVRARLQVLTAASLILEGRYRAGIRWARAAATDAERTDVPAVLAHAHYLLDWAYTDLGDPRAADHRDLALPIYEALGDFGGQANVLQNLGANAYFEGRWDEALDHYERSRRARDRAGDAVQTASASSNIAEVLLQQGHLERADELFRSALRVLRGARFRIGEAWALCNLGVIASRSGRFGEARDLLREARELFEHISADSYALESRVRLAETAVLAGDHVEARRQVAETLERVTARGGLHYLEAALHRAEGYALLQGGEHVRAAEALARSLERAEGAGTTYEVALTLEAMARLARVAGGSDEGAAERSLELLAGLGVEQTPLVPLPSGTADDPRGPVARGLVSDVSAP